MNENQEKQLAKGRDPQRIQIRELPVTEFKVSNEEDA